MTRVLAWVAVLVVCLAGHAHGQLGVRGVEDTLRQGTPITTDHLLTDAHGQGREGERGDALSEERRKRPVVREEWRWRPLLDTYQGCYYEGDFSGTLMYVNLTQVMEVNVLESVEHACFHMCRVWKPLSMYIAINPAVSNGTDGCGCQDLLDPSDKVPDDERCDKEVDHYRLYCGPSHQECLNQGGRATASALLLSLLLAALLPSLVSGYGDIYCWF